MTDYYVELGLDYEGRHANDGLSRANAWGGPVGVQRAIAAAGENDTILAINAPDPPTNEYLDTLIKMGVVSTTNIDPGDLLENQTQTGSMRIAAVATDNYVMGEIVSGAFSSGDTVTPDGGTTTTTTDTSAAPSGLLISSALAANNITLQGVDFNNRGPDHAYFYCNSNCNGIMISGAHDWTLAYLHFVTPASYGVYKDTVVVYDWLLDHIKVTNAGHSGFNWGYYFQYGRMRFCEAIGATTYGYRTTPLFGLAEFCIARDCGLGVHEPRGVLDSWLIVDNTNQGVKNPSSRTVLKGCTIDGNGGDGIGFTTTPDGITLLRNRITNNGGYGLSLFAYGDNWLLDGNVWYGNTSGTSDNVAVGETDHGPVGDPAIPTAANRDVAADGYVDQAAGDYALLASAVHRRIAHPVGSDNAAYVTSGLPAGDLTPADTADVRSGAVYADGSLTGAAAPGPFVSPWRS